MRLQVIDCKHFDQCSENRYGGCCAIGDTLVTGPRPSYGACNACEKREAIEHNATAIRPKNIVQKKPTYRSERKPCGGCSRARG